jgi:uncharacterized protein (UPF0333 family)
MKMEKRKMILLAVFVVVVVGGLSFYGGMKYQSSKSAASRAGSFARGAGAAGFARGGAGGGLIAGQVVAVDSTSITIQESDGSSKIVFFTATTPVMEMVAGKASDITVGKQVNIVGMTNSDGSISATSVQLRPAAATGQLGQPMQPAQ